MDDGPGIKFRTEHHSGHGRPILRDIYPSRHLGDDGVFTMAFRGRWPGVEVELPELPNGIPVDINAISYRGWITQQ